MEENFLSGIFSDGKIKITVVPNSPGSIITYNPVTKELSTRTNEQIISDIGLVTTQQLGNYVPLTGTTAFDGVLTNNYTNYAFGKGTDHKARLLLFEDDNPDFTGTFNLNANIEESFSVTRIVPDGREGTFRNDANGLYSFATNGIESSEVFNEASGLYNTNYKEPLSDNYYIQKKYVVDNYASISSLGNYVAKTGDSMSGPLTIASSGGSIMTLRANNITDNYLTFVRYDNTAAYGYIGADGGGAIGGGIGYNLTVRAVNGGNLRLESDSGNILANGEIVATRPWVDLYYTPKTRNITINGITYDLSADRNWDIVPTGNYIPDTVLNIRQINDADDALGTNFYYLNGDNKPTGVVDGVLKSFSYDDDLWYTQMFSDWRTNEWYVRNKNNGTWNSWSKLYHSGNLDINSFHKIDIGGSISNGSNTRSNKSWFDNNWAATGHSGSVINFSGLSGGGLYSTELFGKYDQGGIVFGLRTKNGDTATWNPVRWLWHSGNFNPNDYVDKTSAQDITGYKTFFSYLGGDVADNRLWVRSSDGSNPGMSFIRDGVGNGQIIYNGEVFAFLNTNSSGYVSVVADGFNKAGSSNSYVLTGGGGHRTIDDFVTNDSWNNITGKKWFKTDGGNTWDNNTVRIQGINGYDAGLTFFRDGIDTAQIIFNGYHFNLTNSDNTGFKQIKTAGFIKDGSDVNYVLLGNGDHKLVSDFASSTDLSGYVTLDTDQNNITGQKTFSTSYNTYTEDGLFNSDAKPLKTITPSSQNILFGYRDYGGGQYYPRIGFKNDASLTNWSFGLNGNDVTLGVNNSASTDTFTFSPNGNISIYGNNVWHEGILEDYHNYGLGRDIPVPTPDLNLVNTTSIQDITDITLNRPFDYGSVWTHKKNGAEYTQMAVNVLDGRLYTRGQYSAGYTGWQRMALYSELSWKANALENATGIGFSASDYPTNDGVAFPYIYHNNAGSNTPYVALATQAYVQNTFATIGSLNDKVNKSGDTMTGDLTVPNLTLSSNFISSQTLNGSQVLSALVDRMYIGNGALDYLIFESKNELTHYQNGVAGTVWTTHNFNPDSKANAWDNAIAIGFSGGNVPTNDGSQYPYMYHSVAGGAIALATQGWVNNTFATLGSLNNKVDKSGDTMTGDLHALNITAQNAADTLTYDNLVNYGSPLRINANASLGIYLQADGTDILYVGPSVIQSYKTLAVTGNITATGNISSNTLISPILAGGSYIINANSTELYFGNSLVPNVFYQTNTAHYFIVDGINVGSFNSGGLGINGALSLNGQDVATQPWVNANYTPISHVGSGGTAHANATTSTAGFMSSADKVKLDNIDTSNFVTINTTQTVTGSKSFADGSQVQFLGGDGNHIIPQRIPGGAGTIVSGHDYTHYDTRWRVGNVRGGSTNSTALGFFFSSDNGSSFSNRVSIDSANGQINTAIHGNSAEWNDIAQNGLRKGNTGFEYLEDYREIDNNTFDANQPSVKKYILVFDSSSNGHVKISNMVNSQEYQIMNVSPLNSIEIEVDGYGVIDSIDPGKFYNYISHSGGHFSRLNADGTISVLI